MFRRVLTREMQWRFQVVGIFSIKKVLRDKLFEKRSIFIKAHWILINYYFTVNHNIPMLEMTTGSLLMFSDLP